MCAHFCLLARQVGERLAFCMATMLENCIRITDLPPSNVVRLLQPALSALSLFNRVMV